MVSASTLFRAAAVGLGGSARSRGPRHDYPYRISASGQGFDLADAVRSLLPPVRLLPSFNLI